MLSTDCKSAQINNIATENVIGYLQSQGVDLGLDMEKLKEATEYANRIFLQ